MARPRSQPQPLTPPRGKAAWIADAIRDEIAAGSLRPGDALPQEALLMQRYDVSQPTMRAALRILEADGLVRIQWGPGGGPRVQELDVDVLAKRAGLYLQVEGADLADLLEALLLLQPGAVALAAARRTPDQVVALRDCVARVYQCASMAEFSDVAADFVVLLLEASGNQSIKLFALVTRSLIHQELNRFLAEMPTTRERLDWHASRFEEVVDAIEAGEAETAAALWRAHMLRTIPSPDAARSDLTRADGAREVSDLSARRR